MCNNELYGVARLLRKVAKMLCFSLAGHQVPTKAGLSLLLLKWTGKKKNTVEGSWAKIKTGRDHSPITVTDKTDLTWGEINLLQIKSE